MLSNEVECDEAYVIAGHKGQPEVVKNKGRQGRRRRLKGKCGRGTLEKERPPVFGMMPRGASSRNWRIRVRQAGKSSRHVRSFANTEPALARPAGDKSSTRSAQRTKRWTFIKRDVVWTLGGVRQASTVCLSRLDTRPQADRKVANCG